MCVFYLWVEVVVDCLSKEINRQSIFFDQFWQTNENYFRGQKVFNQDNNWNLSDGTAFKTDHTGSISTNHANASPSPVVLFIYYVTASIFNNPSSWEIQHLVKALVGLFVFVKGTVNHPLSTFELRPYDETCVIICHKWFLYTKTLWKKPSQPHHKRFTALGFSRHIQCCHICVLWKLIDDFFPDPLQEVAIHRVWFSPEEERTKLQWRVRLCVHGCLTSSSVLIPSFQEKICCNPLTERRRALTREGVRVQYWIA